MDKAWIENFVMIFGNGNLLNWQNHFLLGGVCERDGNGILCCQIICEDWKCYFWQQRYNGQPDLSQIQYSSENWWDGRSLKIWTCWRRARPNQKCKNLELIPNKKPEYFYSGFSWYLQGSNQGHMDFQSIALPSELRYLAYCECKYRSFFKLSKTFFKKNELLSLLNQIFTHDFSHWCWEYKN